MPSSAGGRRIRGPVRRGSLSSHAVHCPEISTGNARRRTVDRVRSSGPQPGRSGGRGTLEGRPPSRHVGDDSAGRNPDLLCARRLLPAGSTIETEPPLPSAREAGVTALSGPISPTRLPVVSIHTAPVCSGYPLAPPSQVSRGRRNATGADIRYREIRFIKAPAYPENHQIPAGSAASTRRAILGRQWLLVAGVGRRSGRAHGLLRHLHDPRPYGTHRGAPRCQSGSVRVSVPIERPNRTTEPPSTAFLPRAYTACRYTEHRYPRPELAQATNRPLRAVFGADGGDRVGISDVRLRTSPRESPPTVAYQ